MCHRSFFSRTPEGSEGATEVLDGVAKSGKVAVLGSDAAIKAANDERGGFMEVTKVL